MMGSGTKISIAGVVIAGLCTGPGIASAKGPDMAALGAGPTVSSSLLAMALDAPAPALPAAGLFERPADSGGAAGASDGSVSYITVPEPGAATVVAMFGLIGLRRRHRLGDRDELMKHRNAQMDGDGRVWRRVAAPGFHGVMGETVWIEDRRARA